MSGRRRWAAVAAVGLAVVGLAVVGVVTAAQRSAGPFRTAAWRAVGVWPHGLSEDGRSVWCGTQARHEYVRLRLADGTETDRVRLSPDAREALTGGGRAFFDLGDGRTAAAAASFHTPSLVDAWTPGGPVRTLEVPAAEDDALASLGVRPREEFGHSVRLHAVEPRRDGGLTLRASAWSRDDGAAAEVTIVYDDRHRRPTAVRYEAQKLSEGTDPDTVDHAGRPAWSLSRPVRTRRGGLLEDFGLRRPRAWLAVRDASWTAPELALNDVLPQSGNVAASATRVAASWRRITPWSGGGVGLGIRSEVGVAVFGRGPGGEPRVVGQTRSGAVVDWRWGGDAAVPGVKDLLLSDDGRTLVFEAVGGDGEPATYALRCGP